MGFIEDMRLNQIEMELDELKDELNKVKFLTPIADKFTDNKYELSMLELFYLEQCVENIMKARNGLLNLNHLIR